MGGGSSAKIWRYTSILGKIGQNNGYFQRRPTHTSAPRSDNGESPARCPAMLGSLIWLHHHPARHLTQGKVSKQLTLLVPFAKVKGHVLKEQQTCMLQWLWISELYILQTRGLESQLKLQLMCYLETFVANDNYFQNSQVCVTFRVLEVNFTPNYKSTQ